ncbi:MAG: dienelactone hydrolase family protein [Myxococcota bacterium]
MSVQPVKIETISSSKPEVGPDDYRYQDVAAFIEETSGDRIDVSFESKGETLAGHIYGSGGNEKPGVVLIGPETYVKEQVPAAYAKRLADRGYVALTFDPRFRGQSGGEPRNLESPLSKIDDIHAATAYLESREDVDPRRIFAIAICQGSSEMVPAAAEDDRIKAFATLAGHYRDREGDIQWFGSEEALEDRKAAAQEARRKYDETGEIEVVPAVHKTDASAGMPGELVWSWYHRWAEEGLPWPNRFAKMSDAELLNYESMSGSARVHKPYLMFHSDACMLPDAAKRHFAAIPDDRKEVEWWGDIAHLQFYDDARVIDPATDRIDAFFRQHS